MVCTSTYNKINIASFPGWLATYSLASSPGSRLGGGGGKRAELQDKEVQQLKNLIFAD